MTRPLPHVGSNTGGTVTGPRAVFPHCDTRILHAPSECEYCDHYPEWQELRKLWGVAFTGHEPQETQWGKELPCPADFNRPPETQSDHRQWYGNRAWPAANPRRSTRRNN